MEEKARLSVLVSFNVMRIVYEIDVPFQWHPLLYITVQKVCGSIDYVFQCSVALHLELCDRIGENFVILASFGAILPFGQNKQFQNLV